MRARGRIQQALAGGVPATRALIPWHASVAAGDVTRAKTVARSRARRLGIDLMVAAAIGPCSNVLPDPAEDLAATYAA